MQDYQKKPPCTLLIYGYVPSMGWRVVEFLFSSSVYIFLTLSYMETAMISIPAKARWKVFGRVVGYYAGIAVQYTDRMAGIPLWPFYDGTFLWPWTVRTCSVQQPVNIPVAAALVYWNKYHTSEAGTDLGNATHTPFEHGSNAVVARQ
jgi:hypothetical protein